MDGKHLWGSGICDPVHDYGHEPKVAAAHLATNVGVMVELTLEIHHERKNWSLFLGCQMDSEEAGINDHSSPIAHSFREFGQQVELPMTRKDKLE